MKLVVYEKLKTRNEAGSMVPGTLVPGTGAYPGTEPGTLVS